MPARKKLRVEKNQSFLSGFVSLTRFSEETGTPNDATTNQLATSVDNNANDGEIELEFSQTHSVSVELEEEVENNGMPENNDSVRQDSPTSTASFEKAQSIPFGITPKQQDDLVLSVANTDSQQPHPAKQDEKLPHTQVLPSQKPDGSSVEQPKAVGQQLNDCPCPVQCQQSQTQRGPVHLTASHCKPRQPEQQTEGPELQSHMDDTLDVFVQGTYMSFPKGVSVEKFCREVAAVTKVPEGLLYLTVGGHCVTDETLASMPSGATLQYTVRGKGGMQDEQNLPQTECKPIHPDATEDQVRSWLVDTCALAEDQLSPFDYMDGATLFDFKDFQSLMEVADISSGLARKILFLRDFPDCKSGMLKWSPQDVLTFIQQSLKIDKDFPSIRDNKVDGVAFFSLKTVKEFETELDMKGMIAKRICVERDKFLSQEDAKRGSNNFEQMSSCQLGRSALKEESASKSPAATGEATSFDSGENLMCSPPHPESEDQRQGQELSVRPAERSPDTNTGANICSDALESRDSLYESNALFQDDTTGRQDGQDQHEYVIVLHENDELTPCKLFVQNFLHLQPLKISSDTNTKKDLVHCDLKVLYHKRKLLNKLEECFLFVLLCHPNFCKGEGGKKAYTKLWDIIVDSVPTLWCTVLPPDVQNKFTFDRERVFCDESPISFEKESTKICSLLEFDKILKIHGFCAKILIVDRSLLNRDCRGYTCELGTRKKSVPYHFGFRKSKKYWTYDPNNFDARFDSLKIAASEAGNLPRCKFELKRPTAYSDSPSASVLESDTASEEAVQLGGNILGQAKTVSPLSVSVDQKTEDMIDELADAEKDTVKCNSPRPFQTQKWTYHEGILRVIETGDGMLSRSGELKFQCNCAPEDDLAKRSFLYKSLEFVCGCLNSRQNGTIYFGVAEGQAGGICYEYGQIVGIEMDQSLSSQYYDLFRNYIDACFPDHAEIVKMCVTGPFFIPVRNSSPQKYVIEVDVKAGAKQCRDTLFVLQPKSIFDEFSWPERKHVYLRKQDNWTGIFRRDGSATKYVGQNEKKEFVHYTLPRLISRREDEERSDELRTYKLMSSPDAEKLKTFIEQCDNSMFPLLVLPKLSENDKLKDVKHFRFIHHIRWSAVFDFDDESARDGIYSITKDSNKAFEVRETVVHDFGDMSVEDRKDQLVFPKMSAWLFANGKATGPNRFDTLELNKWKNRYWTYIQNAIAFYKDNSVIPPTRRLVLVLVSDEVDNGILEASQDIKTAFGWNSVLFVFHSESSRKYFADELSDDILPHSVCMPWQHVHYVVCECLNIKGQNRDKYVRTASGAHVPVPLNEWQSWNDLEILSTKECQDEWEGMSIDRRESKAQEEEMKFHQGKPVSWWNFFLTSQACNHVMKRPIMTKILDHIDTKLRKADSDVDRVPIVLISHMPGAGGTTLGKSVLWELKERYKCAVVRKITGDTEREVCQFWETAEGGVDKNLLQPVILLADNLTNDSSTFDEFELCRRLFRKQKELQCEKPLAVLIHCHRDVKPEGELKLTHKLEEEEKAWLEKKHKELEQQHLDGGIGTLIAFLSMRNEFDKDFLQNTVTQFIDHHTLEKTERQLIEYLSLMSSYFPISQGFPALPVTACDELMRTYQQDFARMLPWERTLSKVAHILLVIEYRYETESPMNIVRIANQPYAKVILETVLNQNNETLSELVMRCLQSPLVSNNSPSSKTVIQILSKMLIERQVKEETAKITQLSPLITEIKDTDFEQAARVLEEGYKRLRNEVFYQQLARLYMTADKYERAKEFAQLAVQLSPTKRDFKHTLGLVHLKIFNSLTAKVRFHPQKVNDNIEHLRVAFDALENFIAAQGKKVEDDALSICYAHCDTIEVVNRVLQFLEKLLPQRELYRLGHYLTEEETDFPLFDEKSGFRETLKSLIMHSIKALRFLYFVGYSHKFPKTGVSYRTIRDIRTLVYVKETCKRQFKLFASFLKTIHKHPKFGPGSNAGDPKMDNACRLEVIKLMGCFFESIFNFFKNPQNRLSGRVLVVDTQVLQSIRHHLEQITDMSFADMDNLMTVSLALELAGQEHAFSCNHTRFYKMCCEIIRAKDCGDDSCRMRAHMYRILISWPNKEREDFNEEHFLKSFHNKAPPLMNRKDPVPPKVYFSVVRPDQPFYICYWKDVYGDNDNVAQVTEMSLLLENFRGRYKVIRKENGEQHSRIDMNWKCAVGVLQLKIYKIRGLKVFRNENVEFFLGFSLYGPVAFIHRILSSDTSPESCE